MPHYSTTTIPEGAAFFTLSDAKENGHLIPKAKITVMRKDLQIPMKGTFLRVEEEDIFVYKSDTFNNTIKIPIKDERWWVYFHP